MSDIDTAVVDSLKALDPERPIREASNNIAAQRMKLSANSCHWPTLLTITLSAAIREPAMLLPVPLEQC